MPYKEDFLSKGIWTLINLFNNKMKNGMRWSEWVAQCKPDNMLLKSGLHLAWVKLAKPELLRTATWGLYSPAWTQAWFTGFKRLSHQ